MIQRVKFLWLVHVVANLLLLALAWLWLGIPDARTWHLGVTGLLGLVILFAALWLHGSTFRFSAYGLHNNPQALARLRPVGCDLDRCDVASSTLAARRSRELVSRMDPHPLCSAAAWRRGRWIGPESPRMLQELEILGLRRADAGNRVLRPVAIDLLDPLGERLCVRSCQLRPALVSRLPGLRNSVADARIR